MHKIVLAVLALFFLCCGKIASPPEPVVFQNNFAFDSVNVAKDYSLLPDTSIAPISVKEASGGVLATSFPHHVWLVNDSGDNASLYLVNCKTGKTTATLLIEGLVNMDWEELTFFVSDNIPMLGIADVGDNLELRDFVTVYTMKEPQEGSFDTLVSGVINYVPEFLDSLRFTYSTGPRDVEAVFVDPVSENWYFISKRESRNGLYELSKASMGSGIIDTAQLKGRFSMYLSTAADSRLFANDSCPIILRNYDRILLWRRDQNTSVIDVMQREPELLPYGLSEPQGECLWLWPNGNYSTTSEERQGIKAPIRTYRKG